MGICPSPYLNALHIQLQRCQTCNYLLIRLTVLSSSDGCVSQRKVPACGSWLPNMFFLAPKCLVTAAGPGVKYVLRTFSTAELRTTWSLLPNLRGCFSYKTRRWRKTSKYSHFQLRFAKGVKLGGQRLPKQRQAYLPTPLPPSGRAVSINQWARYFNRVG